MNALVRICAGEARANSRDVAASFEKNHRDVLRSIDRLIEEAPDACAHFCAHVYRVAGPVQREARAFDMDRDGFALLAMGFTGPKALRWKLAYIDAFNRMEAELIAAVANDDTGPIVSAEQLDQAEARRIGLQLVREARILGGRAAGRRAWAMIPELPDVFSEDPVLAALAHDGDRGDVDPVMREWAASRLIAEEGHVIRTCALFQDYVTFARARSEQPITQTSFGRGLKRLRLWKIKTAGGYSAIRGVRLAD